MGDGNHGVHGDERAREGYLMLLEVAGGTGYAQVAWHAFQSTERDAPFPL